MNHRKVSIVSHSFALLAFLLVPSVALAESIRSFSAEYELEQNGSFTATETIEYDFEGEERHGIFRTVPTSHPQNASAWYKERFIAVEPQSVTMDGQPVPYVDESTGSEFTLRIGDPDRTISGTHTYVISYRVHGALFYGDDYAEFYWNVTGSDWDVPMLRTSAVLRADPALLRGEATCYEGEPGATTRCSANVFADSVEATAAELAPGEGMTLAAALDPATVAYAVTERTPPYLPVGGTALVLLVLLTVGAYRIRTAHRKPTTVVAQYEPYAGVRPMYAGVLADGSLDARDVTAGIVYLAEQGFLKIRRTDRSFLFFNIPDYALVLQRDVTEPPSPFLRSVLSLLFDESAREGATVTLSSIKKNLPKQTLNQKILSDLRASLKEELRIEGYFEHAFSFPGPRWALAGAVSVVLPLVAAGLFEPLFFALAIGYAALLLIVCAICWRRRTAKGYEARTHLRGFKEFLSVTDKDRFDFHNAPERNPETFMRYLPYAIAFGVEEKWARVFDDITMPNPSWYDGGTHGAFSATAFAHDLGTFSSSVSSSSGTSPSGGGGSSGGGAGGGGGGSW